MAEATFAAAHQLYDYHGPCEKIHGHTFKVQVFLQGKKLNQSGILVDFKEVKLILREILKKLDHGFLNKLPAFRKVSPTSENIARYIAKEFRNSFKSKFAKLVKVSVWESPATFASYFE